MIYKHFAIRANTAHLCGNEKLLLNNLKQLRVHTKSTAPRSSVNATDDQTFAQEWQQAKPFDDMPTMTGFTLLRNFLPGGKYTNYDTTQMVMAVKDELGPISKLEGVFGRPDTVMSHNPDDIEKTLRNEGIWPVRPGADGLAYHRNVHRCDFFQGVEGLLSSQGERWGTFRTAVNPVLMQPKNVRLYLRKMSQVNKEFLERILAIRDPNTFEVPGTFEEELNRWTLESVSVVALDKQLGLLKKNLDNPEAKRLFGLLTDFFTLSVDMEFKPPIWKFYKTKAFKKFMRTLDGITDITSKYVEEAIERLEEDRRNGMPERPESEKSMLEKLIKIDKKIATVMAMDMMMAGVDTTTSAFTSLLLCLAKNPEKQQRLREEVMQVLPQKDSDFDEAAFNNMPYLRACLKESLRVYPLTLGKGRVIDSDVVLSGYQVPKGTQVSLVNTSLLNNDEYYPRANEYLPERWLRPSKEEKPSDKCPHAMKSENPFIFLPFGFGKRTCVGRRVTEMEMEVGIARLVRNFHIEFNHPTEKAFKSLFISVPNIPLKFKFTDVKE